MNIPDAVWYAANLAFAEGERRSDPPLVDMKDGYVSHRVVFMADLEISIDPTGGGAAPVGWITMFWNDTDGEWQELMAVPGSSIGGWTAEECMFNAIEALQDWQIPNWTWDLRPIDNPFLRGEEKLQLIMDFERMCVKLNNVWPSPFN